MNIEKQTLFNTEHLETLYTKKSTAVACYGGGKRYGGIRFTLKAKTAVRFSVCYDSLSGAYDLYLDGVLIGSSSKKECVFELKTEKGEHIFETDCAVTHGDLKLTVEAVGLEEGRRYIDRVGGYSDEDQTVVWLKEGDRKVREIIYRDSTLTEQAKDYRFYDEAYLYDRTNEAYTATRRKVYAENEETLVLDVGASSSKTVDKLCGLAICDGRTLASGTDYLVAYCDKNGDLAFIRGVDGSSCDSGCFSGAIHGMLRVVSAQKGSVFMAENKEHCWTGYYFHENGAKTLAFPQSTLHYDEIPLCRNKHCAPTATVDENGAPVFFCKKEDGRLMRLAYGGTEMLFAYADACHPGEAGDLLQFDGEQRPYAQ